MLVHNVRMTGQRQVESGDGKGYWFYVYNPYETQGARIKSICE